MKDKRQKLIMSWAATAPLHAWSLALQHVRQQYSCAAPTSPPPHYRYASWAAAAAAAAAYSPVRLIDDNLDSRRSANNGCNLISDQLSPLSRDDDVTSGPRDDVTTTTSLFRPYNLP